MGETALARFSRRRRTFQTAIVRAELEGIEPMARLAAIVVWQRRHANEQASVALAERMLAQASAIGSRSELVNALERLAEDERSHVTAAAVVLEAFDAPLASPQPLRAPLLRESPALSLARDILVGLAVCETISAARFATVRGATDIPMFRRLVDGFLRDEIAHSALGFDLVADARALVSGALGHGGEAEAWLLRELMTALGELEVTIGLNGARNGLMPPRPQPTNNPGIVEPNLDALAFYDAVTRRILPRLAARGLHAARAWSERSL